MAEFVSPDPNLEIIGLNVWGYITALGDEILPIAAKYGFDNVNLQQWYKLQSLLDLLKEITACDMPFALTQIGMCTTFEYIPPAETITDYFRAFPHRSKQIYRNGNVSDWYQAKFVLPGQIELMCKTPFPCDLEFCAIYEEIHRLRPFNTRFSVVHCEGACRNQGDDYCVYAIKW